MQNAEALPSLIEIFHQLDADKSGLITHDEVENVPVTILPPRVLDSLCVENITDIFDYLDVDTRLGFSFDHFLFHKNWFREEVITVITYFDHFPRMVPVSSHKWNLWRAC